MELLHPCGGVECFLEFELENVNSNMTIKEKGAVLS